MAEPARAWRVIRLHHVAFAHEGDDAPGVLTGLVDGDDWCGVGSGGLRLLGHSVVRFIGLGN